MKFKCEIDMNNAAFDDRGELVRVLREVACEIKYERTSGTIRDSNGNKVGEYSITGRR